MSLNPGSMTRLSVALVLAAAAFGCSAPGSPAVFSVGSRKVTVEDFTALARQPGVLAPYVALPESLQKRALLNDLMEYETIAAAAMRDGLDKDSAYVKFDRGLPQRVLPDALYEAKVGSQAKASDDEAKLFYDRQGTEYELAVIMTTDSTIMPSLIARLNRGEAFDVVARTGSQDPSSSADGGKLGGWYTLGQFAPEIEDAIRPLKKNERTGPVHQRQGTFVFKVLDTRPRQNAPEFATQKEQIKQSLTNHKRASLADRYLAGIKKSYALKLEGPGWQVVNGVMVSLPESLSHFLATDPKRAGLTDEDLGQTIATWRDKNYRVRDLLTDLTNSDIQDRPPTTRTDLFKTFVEGKAMTDILVREAKSEGLDKRDKIRRTIDQSRTRWLVEHYLSKVMPQVESPTPAELDSVTAAMVAARGGAPSAGQPAIHFKDLPPAIQQQISTELQGQKQKKLVKVTVDRLRAELKPKVNEKVFDAIPWPIEPEPQEQA